jgi:hypothetical protein
MSAENKKFSEMSTVEQLQTAYAVMEKRSDVITYAEAVAFFAIMNEDESDPKSVQGAQTYSGEVPSTEG